MNKEKLISVGVLVLIVGAIVAFAMYGKSDSADLANSQDATVATVNGVEIKKSTYDSQYASAITSLQSQGIDTTSTTSVATIRTQVLDNLIANELVNQSVAKAGVKATDAEVEAQYQAIVTQAGGVDKFKEQLTAANLTDAELRANIAKQLSVQMFLLQSINNASTTVTDAEVKKFYDDNTKGQTGVPTFAEVSAQIRQQLITNKQQVLVNEFIAKLRASAEVETSLN